MTLRLHPDEIVDQSASPLLSIAPSWERVRLGEVADIVNGAAFKSSLFNNDGRGEPLVRIRDVGGDEAQVHYDGPYEKRHVIDHGDLLVGMDGDFRVARWGGGRALLNQRVCRVAVKDPDLYDERLLLYVLQPYLDAVHAVTSSVTVKHLSSRTVQDLPIPLPPRAEQGRIVAAIEEHLSRLDAAEAVLRSAEERVALLAQAGVRELFKSRPWPWKTLGDIAEIKGGVTKDSKRQSDPAFVEVPYLRVANVQRGRLDLSDVTTIRVHPDKAKALRLEPGDVLMNEGGDRDKLGRGWVWEGQVTDCIHQNHVFRARLNDDFDPYFVSTHANTWGQAWFEEHGRQTTNLASINLGTLKQLPVPAPPRSEQEAIVAQLHVSSEAQKRLVASIGHAQARGRALRRSILAAAFSGQLVQRDPDDGPASELLDHIKAERAAAAPTKRTRKAKAS